MIVGLCTILCQYIWIGSLLYNMGINFNFTSEIQVIIVTIVSTIITILYCYGTLTSFINSRGLYKILLQVYKDHPELSAKYTTIGNNIYKNSDISMRRSYIKYNYICDIFSNCLLPLMLPFINFFIIISSDSVIDAILNSVAIFFIIQIDEDLYMQTDYERDNQHLLFTRWFISTIFSKLFPNKKHIFCVDRNPLRKQHHRKPITFFSTSRIQPDNNNKNNNKNMIVNELESIIEST